MVWKLLHNYRLKKAVWKLKLNGYSAIADPKKIIHIPPEDIEYMISKSQIESSIPVYGVLDGDWDKRAYPFENNAVYDSFVERFEYGADWEETDFYKDSIERINKGKAVPGMEIKHPNMDTFEEYLCYFDGLYRNIKNQGYKRQSELKPNQDFIGKSPHLLNEITLLIGRNGQIICQQGKHRLSITRILNLGTVPVRIRIRHKGWQKTREALVNQQSDLERFEQDVFEHPDLQDILSKQV